MIKKHLVISAVNLVEGGTLAIFRDCLIEAQKEFGSVWRITALVHRSDLFDVDGIEYIEFPEIKRSWLARVWFEYVKCRQLSLALKADFWLALHDMTPVVSIPKQAVYCHNAMCFYKMTWRETLQEPKLRLFSSFYSYLYRINIHANTAIIVQQNWIRHEFEKRFGAKNIIVSYPVKSIANRTVAIHRQGKRFIYPSLPRFFKNFETLLEAWELLCKESDWDAELTVTIDGTENQYAQKLLARYKNLRNVRFTGRITPHQVQEEYSKNDCLVFPSRLETWGLPLSEAKLHGLAILAADLPYAHEAVGNYDAAAFFPPQDAACLASLMYEFSKGTIVFYPVDLADIEAPFASNWKELLNQLLVTTNVEPNKEV